MKFHGPQNVHCDPQFFHVLKIENADQSLRGKHLIFTIISELILDRLKRHRHLCLSSLMRIHRKNPKMRSNLANLLHVVFVTRNLTLLKNSKNIWKASIMGTKITFVKFVANISTNVSNWSTTFWIFMAPKDTTVWKRNIKRLFPTST